MSREAGARLAAGGLLVALARLAFAYDAQDKDTQDRAAIPPHPSPCTEQVSARPAAASSPAGSQPAAADSPCMDSESRSATPGNRLPDKAPGAATTENSKKSSGNNMENTLRTLRFRIPHG